VQTISAQLDSAFRSAVRAAFGFDADPLIAPSANPQFGDYQSNCAMSLAKDVAQKTGQKTNPRAVAEQIKSHLQLGDLASEVSIAGPGFLNVRLNPRWVAQQLQSIAADDRLGIEKDPHPQTVVVDYSGPNVAKELHVGHLRSTIIGDAVCNVLEFAGEKVIRQNHIGDWGTQFGMLIAHLTDSSHVGMLEKHISDLEDFYRAAKKRFDEDPDFQNKARETVVRLQSGTGPERAAWQAIVKETRNHYQPLYKRLGVKLTETDERGESFYNPRLPSIVSDLKQLNLATESDGATVVFIDGEKKPPLIIEKTGGGYLYGTTDLAAVRYRVWELHADRIIYFTDARQAHHFRQVFETAKKAGWTGNASLEHAAFGTMLGPDGKPFKTRTGGTVKLADLLTEAEDRALKLVTEKSPDMPEQQRRDIARAVGIGGVKYADLSKDRISDYVFDFDRMLSMEGNTAPYLQYAHARIKSIIRKAGIQNSKFKIQNLILDTSYELSLAKHVLRLGEILDSVARELKLHILCSYLYDLATLYSGFYENCPVIQSEEPLRSSRLLLVHLTARTLEIGLDLLGIEHPDQM
jgi:arginyl-tRNA synthetase